jgi:hypothetical protein
MNFAHYHLAPDFFNDFPTNIRIHAIFVALARGYLWCILPNFLLGKFSKKIRFENLLNDKQWTPGDFSSSEKSRSNGKGQISL